MDITEARQNYIDAVRGVELARIFHNGSLSSKQKRLVMATAELLKAEAEEKRKWIREIA